jgi:hypothetical protein
MVIKIATGLYSDQEYSSPILRNAKIFRVQNCPLYPITCGPISSKLIIEQCSTFSICHTINVFNDEGKRLCNSQNSIKLAIQKVNGSSPIASSTLGVALAWVATNEDLGSWKFAAFRNVGKMNFAQA